MRDMQDEWASREMDPPIIELVDEELWAIDLRFQGVPRVIAAWLLAGDGRLALFDTGPASTLPALRAGIAATGHRLEDLTDIVLSHIHLDHGGATGHLVAEAAGATVHVHPAGARHLVDPSRLWASAARIYGDRMEMLWGAMEPVPAERIRTPADGDTLDLAGRSLAVLHTPGHASHHIALHDPARRMIFAGDTAGVRVPGTGYVCPPTPPPDLDPDLWHATIARLAALDARRLCLAHFGMVTDVAAHLGALGRNLNCFRDLAVAALAAGADGPELTARISAAMAAGVAGGTPGVEPDPTVLAELEWATPAFMAAMGLTRYVTKAGLVASPA
ncbi:MAG TPA: MBL fold metallo-hydrolase [Thermomicrobiales bacterium]|jgi:glyoxylase-like metal-dependent hydrolase (beta-lactamase superfamily II)|nr:MBL fold metallo-hydrolase [Thermomicrobiales bacterium]